MKLFRVFLTTLGSIIIFLSSLTLSVSLITQDLFDKNLSKIIIDEIDIESKINNALSIFDGDSRYQIMSDTSKFQEELLKNDEWNEMISKYSKSFITSIISDQLITPDINKDVKDTIHDNQGEIKNIIGDFMNEGEKNQLIKEIINRIDLNPIYEEIVNTTRQQLSPNQVQMLEFVHFFSLDSTMYTSIFFLIGSIVLIIIAKASIYRWLFSVSTTFVLSGICLWIGSYVAPIIFNGIKAQFDQLSNGFSLLFDQARNIGFIYLGIGILGIILYFIFDHLLKSND